MRIAIDARALLGEQSGVGTYTRNLLAGLEKLGGSHEFILCSHKPCTQTDAPFTRMTEPAHFSNLWLQQKLSKGLFRIGADCFHGTNFLAPLRSPCPTVVTVHDLTSFMMPSMHTWQNNLVQRLLPSVLRRASRVIAVSKTTARDLEKRMDVDPGRIRVIPNCVSPIFTDVPEKGDEEFREEFMLPEKFVLFVGTLEPRKNIDGLITGFSHLKRKTKLPHALVIAGGAGWGQKGVYRAHAKSGLGDQVRFLGYVPQEKLPALYRMADAFAYLSHYEGFGLPALEAMACGTPVVLSDAPALQEIAGDAAVFVPATDMKKIAFALEEVLTDSNLAAKLGQKGKRRAAKYSLESAAQKTLDIYLETEGLL